ncbi:MAG: hypothetical protein WCD53_07615 [Microcoleus sp.]
MPQKLSFLSPRKFVPEMLLETTEFFRIDGERLSQIMWEAAMPIAEQAMQTCHIQGIKYGDLDPNKYGFYTVQDAIYCYQATEQYRRLADTATDAPIKQFAEERCKSYEKYTKSLFEKWCINNPSGINLSSELQQYINYKSEVLNTHSSAYFLVSNIPCLRLWTWLANQLQNRLVGPANLYSFWIQDNLSDQSARRLEDFVDSKASELDVNEAIAVYKRCMQGELEFFALAGKVRYYLQEGDFLLPGDRLFSQSQNYQLIYQEDGNLVVYDSSTEKPIWASNTKGSYAWRTYMQDDGNFVVYTDHAKPVWSSGVYKSQYKGSKLFVEDNGNLVIKDCNNNPIWNSKN